MNTSDDTIFENAHEYAKKQKTLPTRQIEAAIFTESAANLMELRETYYNAIIRDIGKMRNSRARCDRYKYAIEIESNKPHPL